MRPRSLRILDPVTFIYTSLLPVNHTHSISDKLYKSLYGYVPGNGYKTDPEKGRLIYLMCSTLFRRLDCLILSVSDSGARFAEPVLHCGNLELGEADQGLPIFLIHTRWRHSCFSQAVQIR